MNARVDIAAIVSAWQALSKSAGIGPIRNEAQYERMISLLESLLDMSRSARRQAALEGLIDILAHFIEAYEDKHHAIPDCPPHEMLRYFMERDGLRQSDLPEIGNQGKVSEILAGKRNLNARQVKLLAGRFKVSPGVFL